MKQQERIDKILKAVKSRVQDEVGSLLGTVFLLDAESYERTSKADGFDQLQGKQICAEMDITGDISGKGCLLLGVKDAIRLGGTLIMLPESELDEVIGREDYSEEIEDSFGEIANIIAGSFTKDFEEMYPKSCRFVRKKQQKIVPAKVEIESDDPVEDKQLYRVRWSMELDGASMGDMVLLLPAATFELEEAVATEGAESADAEKSEPQSEQADGASEAGEVVSENNSPPKVDFLKQKKRVDRLLDECQGRLQSEIGGLLGVTVVLSDIRNYFSKKEEFFEECVGGKKVIADFEVVGDVEDKSFFCIGVKDAVYLGGTLIMLPPSELEATVNEEDFGEDAQDAYGEIANIVSGVYTAVFEEQYIKKFRFIKKGLSKVVPAKVDTDSDEPFPDALYYVSSLSLDVDGKGLGKVQMLFPAAMLDLHPPELEAEASVSPDATSEAAVSSAKEKETIGTEEVADGQDAKIDTNAEEGASRKNAKLDIAKQKARVDKVLVQCQKKMQDEVSSLLGTDVVMENIDNKLINKEDFFFEEVSGKQVLATMDVVGDIEGQSYLSVELKDAIRVGGVLIMLPNSELDAVVAEEDFGEDAADAYGEIANIIAGVYTSVFEEEHTKKIRFIKKGLQQVIPMKVDVESAEPIPDQNYYLSSMTLVIGGTTHGKVNLLFPLPILQLEGLLAIDEPQAGTQTDNNGPAQPEQENIGTEEVASKKNAKLDIAKQKARVDKVLGQCQKKMQDEVSSLLGTDVVMANIDNKLINKEDFFFEEVSGKQVLATMDVVGDIEGQSYLSVELKDAIRVGGVLIMLPNSELDAVVAEEDFGEDAADAYGEIANIIAGVYTSVFEEEHTKKIRFIKKDLKKVIPMKVDVESAEPIPDQNYYLSSMTLVIGGTTHGKVNLLFPLPILELEGLLAIDEPQVEESVTQAGTQTDNNAPAQPEQERGGSSERIPLDILIIGDDAETASTITSTVTEMGLRVKTLSFKDNIHDYIPGELKAIYLVMSDVNEQGFGTAIKISASCATLPLIAAGPAWTRSKVIKAVKYGVRDILLTPASSDDIKENINNNLLDLAA